MNFVVIHLALSTDDTRVSSPFPGTIWERILIRSNDLKTNEHSVWVLEHNVLVWEPHLSCLVMAVWSCRSERTRLLVFQGKFPFVSNNKANRISYIFSRTHHRKAPYSKCRDFTSARGGLVLGNASTCWHVDRF